MDVQSADIDIQTANISWNPPSQPLSLMIEDINQIYTLTVTSSNTRPQTLQLHQHFYVFIAPTGASPYEVYNFSVTATYIGVNYTGAGCSVPSPVLSRMLPSLPDNSMQIGIFSWVLSGEAFWQWMFHLRWAVVTLSGASCSKGACHAALEYILNQGVYICPNYIYAGCMHVVMHSLLSLVYKC